MSQPQGVPMSKYIIPVSSGKGGVGKTSFAVNLALSLSRLGRCVLIDLDTGTSSVRNIIRVPVKKDLYHFFKKGASLEECITRLPNDLDSKSIFRAFGFVASPQHMIHDIVNLDSKARRHMIDGINKLDAEFVILDLMAGLDPRVIDFAPQFNSGILVFTPNHPAAALSASDIAKGIVFRNLRELFGAESAIYQHFPKVNPRAVSHIIDMVEDPYQQDMPNLDTLVASLQKRMPRHPFVNIVHKSIERFQIYYVLNRFDGVESSFETAVKPLITRIHNHLSMSMRINHLGWVIKSEAYHKANARGIPYLLEMAYSKKVPAKMSMVDRKMQELYALAGLKPTPKEAEQSSHSVLEEKHAAMKDMFLAKKNESVVQNFDYIIASLRYIFEHKRAPEFGSPRILKNGEMVKRLLARKMRQQREPRNQA